MVRRDPLTHFNDEDFFELFRFGKADFDEYLVPKFTPGLDQDRMQRPGQGGVRNGQGTKPLTASQELAIGLAFLSTGSFQGYLCNIFMYMTSVVSWRALSQTRCRI